MKSVSATSMSKFDTCTLQWKFNYLLKLLQKKGKALLIGSLYHSCLEMYHSGRTCDTVIKEAKGLSTDDLALVELMLEKYKEYSVAGAVVETEHKFRINVPGVPVPLIGYIDRIDEDKGVEYKTSSRDFKDVDTQTIQAKIYSYVLWKKFGKIVPIMFSVMNKKKAKQKKYKPQELLITHTVKELEELEGLILRFYKNASKGPYNPTPGIHCYWCPWGNKMGDGTCIYSK